MTDRELLELAAKAAGIPVVCWDNGRQSMKVRRDLFAADTRSRWNPLTDDGDALRLAVRLHLNVMVGVVRDPDGRIQVDADSDEYAATRRAIVRAAAEIGRGR